MKSRVLLFDLTLIFFTKKLEDRVIGGGVGVGVGVGAGIVSYLNNGLFWNTSNLTFLLFLFLLPLLNACLDYLSLSISRFFAQKIYNDTSFQALFHIFIDLFFALVFLVVLSLSLRYCIYFLNIFVDNEKLYIPIGKILLRVKDDPFNLQHGWITFMLLSTLIPTLAHFIIAFLGLFVAYYPNTKIQEHIIKYQQSESQLDLEFPAKALARKKIMEISGVSLFFVLLIIFMSLYRNSILLFLNSIYTEGNAIINSLLQ